MLDRLVHHNRQKGCHFRKQEYNDALYDGIPVDFARELKTRLAPHREVPQDCPCCHSPCNYHEHDNTEEWESSKLDLPSVNTPSERNADSRQAVVILGIQSLRAIEMVIIAVAEPNDRPTCINNFVKQWFKIRIIFHITQNPEITPSKTVSVVPRMF